MTSPSDKPIDLMDDDESSELLAQLKLARALMAGQSAVTLPLPASIIHSLKRYQDGHIETGGFLRAVLENDLKEAVGRADTTNQILLPAIVSHCYNHLRSDCWGSPEKVKAWLEA